MTQILFEILANGLEQLGWNRGDGVSVGTKEYATAVGPKQALAYILDFGPAEDSVILTGTYQSEGRNCLSSLMIPIPRTAAAALVVQQLERFAKEADATIAHTYAARLLLHSA